MLACACVRVCVSVWQCGRACLRARVRVCELTCGLIQTLVAVEAAARARGDAATQERVHVDAATQRRETDDGEAGKWRSSPPSHHCLTPPLRNNMSQALYIHTK